MTTNNTNHSPVTPTGPTGAKSDPIIHPSVTSDRPANTEFPGDSRWDVAVRVFDKQYEKRVVTAVLRVACRTSDMALLMALTAASKEGWRVTSEAMRIYAIVPATNPPTPISLDDYVDVTNP